MPSGSANALPEMGLARNEGPITRVGRIYE